MSINSTRDAMVKGMTAEDIYKMATRRVVHDDARYPPNYDKKLRPGQKGYVVPILRYEYVVDEKILKRFNIEV